MAKRQYTTETIIRKLREAEVLQCQTIALAVMQLSITGQAYHRRRTGFGGMRVQAVEGNV